MTRERQQLNYAVRILHQKFKMLEVLGPATEQPEEAIAQMEALAFAASVLRRPVLPTNPFE